MKHLIHRAYGISLITLMSFLIFACASEPAKVDLPDNHPANPQSQGTTFIPPPNPFKKNISMVENEADSSSSMSHEKHQPAHQHQTNPQMGH